jgi:hypothetical protein
MWARIKVSEYAFLEEDMMHIVGFIKESAMYHLYSSSELRRTWLDMKKPRFGMSLLKRRFIFAP